MNKNVIMLRHGRKDGELIAADQILEIENNGIPGVNELVEGQEIFIHYGSHYVRTKQTVQAFEKFSKRTNLFNTVGYLHGDERFGNIDLFSQFIANPEMVAEANATNWYSAFKKANPLFIDEVQSEMTAALWKLFSNLKDGQAAITIGHTPMIEWLIFAIDGHENISRDLKLAELTGVMFTEDAGHIIISEKIGF